MKIVTAWPVSIERYPAINIDLKLTPYEILPFLHAGQNESPLDFFTVLSAIHQLTGGNRIFGRSGEVIRRN